MKEFKGSLVATIRVHIWELAHSEEDLHESLSEHLEIDLEGIEADLLEWHIEELEESEA